MRSLALFISGIFHPVFIPTYICLTVFFLQPLDVLHYSQQHKLVVLILVFLSTALLPMILSYWYIWSAQSGDFMLDKRESRTVPYLVFCINSFLLFYFLRDQELSSFIYKPVFAAALVVLLLTGINFFWKISAHLAAIGGMAAILIVYRNSFLIDPWLVFVLSLLFSALIAGSRLYLKAHNYLQVLAGWFLGYAVIFITLYLW